MGLDYLSNEVKNSDNKYLLSVNALAHDRGQVIIVSGNPDTASHVSTTVPGTFADLGNASDYVADGDRLMDSAGARPDNVPGGSMVKASGS